MAFKMKKFGHIKVDRAPLDSGVLAEARNDGTIVIDANANLNKNQMKRVIKHEMKHMQDMEEGRADYGEDWIMWDGNIYLRRTIDGEKVIDGPAGRLPEGHEDHPWEAEAIAAETQNNKKEDYGI
tara:strand:+ start:226 stop:600 length:375 start_codon:yes stop_codon:yes gene_type:complete